LPGSHSIFSEICGGDNQGNHGIEIRAIPEADENGVFAADICKKTRLM
jgi:hypothetical protein